MPLTRDVKKGSGKAAPTKPKAAVKKPKVAKAPPAPVVPTETPEDLEQDNLLALAATVAPEPAVVPPAATVVEASGEAESLPWENYSPPVEQPQIERTADGKVKMASLIATGRVQPYSPPVDPNLAKLIKLIK